MAMGELTGANFVAKMKAMGNQEGYESRSQKIQQKRINDLICTISDDLDSFSAATQLTEMWTSIENINKSSAVTNNKSKL